MNNRDGKIKTGMLGTLKITETMDAVHSYILESLSTHSILDKKGEWRRSLARFRFAIKKCINQKLKALFQGRVTEIRHTCVISGYK
jgi:hypothetical protein